MTHIKHLFTAFLLFVTVGMYAQSLPKVSSGDAEYWYAISFPYRGSGKGITAYEAGEVTTAEITGDDAQLWKITGNETDGYTFTNKNGFILYVNAAGKNELVKAGTEEVVVSRFAITGENGNLEIRPKDNQNLSMNFWAGTGTRVGLWDAEPADANNYVEFIEVEQREVIDGLVFAVIDGVNTLLAYMGSDTELELPANYNDDSYVIGDNAFKNNATLTSVVIPNSVTSIGSSAFRGCSKLTSVEIPNSVTSIGNYAFCECSGLTSIEIPNSVTSIGGSAFNGCTGLTSIVIPNSVTSIGGSAFNGCTGLTSIVIPNSVTSIGGSAFRDCSGLKTVINYSSLTIEKGSSDYGYVGYYADKVINAPNGSIEGDFAFGVIDGVNVLTQYLGNETRVELPDNYRGEGYIIGARAFVDNTHVEKITIPECVTAIGDAAFYGCTNLMKITMSDNVVSVGVDAFTNTPWYNNEPDGLIYAGKVLYKYKGTMPQGTSVEVKAGTLGIAGSAFSGCSGLTSIEIPNSVTNIGNNAFRGCSGLTCVVIPNSVTSIGGGAFAYCSGLTSIVIPDSVTSIGDDVFRGCSGLKAVYISDISAWCNIDFSNADSNPLYYAKNLYLNGELVTDLVIPNDVTEIKKYAFSYCSGLTSVEIPNSVTSIGNYAFSGCSGLTSIEIPNSVTSIGNYAFSGCSGLTSIEIPNSVTSIGDDAFRGCSGLTSVVIGNSVTSIGSYAFEGCSGLTSVTIGNSVTSIGDWAFGGCSGLTNIVIPNSVTSIGDYAFSSCSGLKTVVNFSNLTFEKGSSDNGYVGYYADKVVNAPNGEMVGDYAFCTVDGENYLAGYIGDDTELVLPSDYNGGNYAIRAAAFKQCASITSVVIPNSVTSIGDNSFAYCTALNSLTLGENVAYIGEGAFEECSALSKIISQVPADGLFVPGDYAFESVDKETCILYVPEGAVSAYQSTDGWNEFENIVDFDPNFTVTYIVDGEVYATDTIAYGDEVVLIDEPVKEGYTFSGWSEIPATMPAEDITVEGSFAVNYYTVTYIVDGEVYATDSIVYGGEIVLINEPVKEGYTFSGWSEVPATMPAEDITVTGSFAVNYYAVTYIVDGEVYATDTIAYGEEIVLIDAPVKDGYTFSGWSEVPATMPAEDITIEGSFAINTYAVTYIVDGEVYATDSIVYGGEIVLINEPAKEYYTFSGWSEVPAIMPAEDVEVYGSFVANSYFLISIVDGELDYYNLEEEKNVDNFAYYRTLPDTKWNSLYVPFDIAVEDIANDYDVAYINCVHSYDRDKNGEIDEMEMEVILVLDGVLKANYPYLIRAKDEYVLDIALCLENTTLYAAEENGVTCSSVFTRFDVVGNYTTQPVQETTGCYEVRDGMWQALNPGAELQPFRHYLYITNIDGSPLKENVVRSMGIRVDGEMEDDTVIDEMKEQRAEGKEVYDLQGRKINEITEKGIYIVNGKKVLVK